jgi:50S ribosomal subunit-associated GTPase HflX
MKNITSCDLPDQKQFQAFLPLCSAVASITDPGSLAGLDNWVSFLASAAGDQPSMVLAVNKIDLRDGAMMTVDTVQTECGNRFARVFFVSALMNEEVDNLFAFPAQAAVTLTESNDLIRTNFKAKCV